MARNVNTNQTDSGKRIKRIEPAKTFIVNNERPKMATRKQETERYSRREGYGTSGNSSSGGGGARTRQALVNAFRKRK